MIILELLACVFVMAFCINSALWFYAHCDEREYPFTKGLVVLVVLVFVTAIVMQKG